MTVDGAFIQKLRNDFFSGRTVIGKLRAAQTVFFIGKQVIQRNYGILPGEVGGNVIRVMQTLGVVLVEILVMTSL